MKYRGVRFMDGNEIFLGDWVPDMACIEHDQFWKHRDALIWGEEDDGSGFIEWEVNEWYRGDWWPSTGGRMPAHLVTRPWDGYDQMVSDHRSTFGRN